MRSNSGLPYILSKTLRKVEPKIIRDFNEISHLQSSRKGSHQFAGFTREKITDTIYYSLINNKEEYGILIVDDNGNILSHKEPFDNKSGYFIAKAIDGFNNFAHHNHNFTIAIAVCEKNISTNNYQITAEIIDNPILGHSIISEKSYGSYNNNKINEISKRRNLSETILTLSTTDLSNELPISLVNNIIISGSPTLDFISFCLGQVDILVHKPKPLPISTISNDMPEDITELLTLTNYIGLLSVTEAKAVATDLQGKTIQYDGKSIIIGNDQIHNQLLKR